MYRAGDLIIVRPDAAFIRAEIFAWQVTADGEITPGKLRYMDLGSEIRVLTGAQTQDGNRCYICKFRNGKGAWRSCFSEELLDAVAAMVVPARGEKKRRKK